MDEVGMDILHRKQKTKGRNKEGIFLHQYEEDFSCSWSYPVMKMRFMYSFNH